MKKGFSFLEVIVTLLIGSVLSLVLFQNLFQTSNALAKVARTTGYQTALIVLDQQWDRDFSGMFAPLKQVPAEKTDEAQKNKPSSAAPEIKKDKNDKEKKESKFQQDSFILKVINDNVVESLSCITSNPALIYKDMMPRMARVVYKVEADSVRPGLFLLKRQQSDTLELAAFTSIDSKIRAYTVVEGIKKITAQAWVQKVFTEKKQQEEDKKKGVFSSQRDQGVPAAGQKKEKKLQPKEWVLWTEWQKMTEEQKKDYKEQPVPSFLKLHVEYVQDEKEYQQTLWYAPCYALESVTVEIPTLLATEKERDGERQAREQYRKIADKVQDLSEHKALKDLGHR